MTREEFIKKFPVGTKIRRPEWNETSWLEILYKGSDKFFACDNDGNDNAWFYEFYWEPYKEPEKPF